MSHAIQSIDGTTNEPTLFLVKELDFKVNFEEATFMSVAPEVELVNVTSDKVTLPCLTSNQGSPPNSSPVHVEDSTMRFEFLDVMNNSV